MAIPREIIDQVRDRTDIVEIVGRHVTLRRAGNTWTGLCPFHQEKTPSFSVVPHKGIYHCFGCGEGGDVFKFLMKLQGLEFMDVVRDLAGPAGIIIEERMLTPDERQRLQARASLYDICDEAARYYQAVLLVRPEGAPGRAYLERRGISRETVQRFQIGFAPGGWTGLVDHLHRQGAQADRVILAGLARRSERGQGIYDLLRERVIFPIHDARDRVVSFGGRLIDTAQADPARSPKYLNGPETEIYSKSHVLYGLTQARGSIQQRDRVVLVEGYFDAVTMVQAGVDETVATCGTALTTDHLLVLRRLTRNVISLFDSDEAGVKAAIRAMPLFVEAGMEPFRIDIPGAKDPDEYIRREGPAALAERLAHPEALIELVIRKEGERFGATPGGRQRALESLASLVGRYPEVARAALVRRIADVFYLPEAEVRRAVDVTGGRGAAPTRPQPRAGPVLSVEIQHLIWLAIHFPGVTIPHLMQVDPEMISPRLDVRDCLAGLLRGRSVSEVVDGIHDPDLRQTVMSMTVREGLYKEESAERAVRQILAGMQLEALDGSLASIHQDLATCNHSVDRARYLDLVQRRVELQRRQKELKAMYRGTLAGGAPVLPDSVSPVVRSKNAQG